MLILIIVLEREIWIEKIIIRWINHVIVTGGVDYIGGIIVSFGVVNVKLELLLEMLLLQLLMLLKVRFWVRDIIRINNKIIVVTVNYIIIVAVNRDNIVTGIIIVIVNNIFVFFWFDFFDDIFGDIDVIFGCFKVNNWILVALIGVVK